MANNGARGEEVKPNGADPPGLADVEAAIAMPNIDGRPSVLTELPKDLFLEDREFAIGDEEPSDEIRFGKPRAQEIVHCHPDASRKRIVWAIKDERNRRGNLYVVTPSLLTTHPRLKEHVKRYVLRQYITDKGVVGLWPAPLPGYREAVSDASHLAAQEDAIGRWVRVWWSNLHGDGRFERLLMSEEDGFGEPVFSDESFEEILRRGLAEWVITTPDHSLAKHLLKGKPVTPPPLPSSMLGGQA
jgi:hypothetical protein